MQFYLVRHGPKQWKNGKKPTNRDGFSHDPPIKIDNETFNIISNLRRKLISDNCIIISSPFIRCIHTSEMLSLGRIKIYTCPLLREYLGNWRNKRSQVRVNHNINNDDMIESWGQFLRRMDKLKRFLSEISSTFYEKRIIIVTHQIVIDQLKESGLMREIVYYNDEK